MDKIKFDILFDQYKKSDVDKKIEIYTTTQGFDKEQYKQLLKEYPYDQIGKLEKALA